MDHNRWWQCRYRQQLEKSPEQWERKVFETIEDVHFVVKQVFERCCGGVFAPEAEAVYIECGRGRLVTFTHASDDKKFPGKKKVLVSISPTHSVSSGL